MDSSVPLPRSDCLPECAARHWGLPRPGVMIRLSLFGRQDLRGDDGAVLQPVVDQPKRFALLAYLATEGARTPRRRDELLLLFWPDLPDARGRRVLSKVVYFLRQELGDGAILRQGGDALALDDSLIWCDVRAFEEAVEQGRLEEALALYRGDFLEGFFAADLPELEQWADAKRVRLRERARASAWVLVEDAERSGDPRAAAEWVRRTLELAPDDERAARKLVTLLHAAGDVAGTMREYELFAKR